MKVYITIFALLLCSSMAFAQKTKKSSEPLTKIEYTLDFPGWRAQEDPLYMKGNFSDTAYAVFEIIVNEEGNVQEVIYKRGRISEEEKQLYITGIKGSYFYSDITRSPGIYKGLINVKKKVM